MSALRCCAAIWSCLILASASSRAFCSDTTLNFSTAPATAPTSSLRPRPGSTTAKLPPASSSIDTLSARIGRAMVKKENMLVAISSTTVPMPSARASHSAVAISRAACAACSPALCLAKSPIWLASGSISVAIGSVTSRAMRAASSFSFAIRAAASAPPAAADRFGANGRDLLGALGIVRRPRLQLLDAGTVLGRLGQLRASRR